MVLPLTQKPLKKKIMSYFAHFFSQIMSKGSGSEICQIIGQDQARIRFLLKSLFGKPTWCLGFMKCTQISTPPMGSLQGSMWELRVVSDPDKVQKVEKFHILSILATEPDAMLYHLKVGIPGSKTDDLHNIFCQ